MPGWLSESGTSGGGLGEPVRLAGGRLLPVRPSIGPRGGDEVGAVIAYLAHSIDQGLTPGRVQEATGMLLAKGYTVYDPARAWLGMSPDPDLQAVNLSAAKQAAVLVAVLVPNRLSVGSVLELIFKEATAPGRAAIYGPDLATSVAIKSLGIPVLDLEGLGDWLDAQRKESE